MAVLPIVITGDPVLHTPAGPVKDFDDALRSLVDDMFETMDAAPGVGLAAPQVGVPLRVFVYGWVDDDDIEYRGVAINPELWLSPLSTVPLHDMAEAEGCLSVPGERYPLRRAHRIILRALDLDGQPYEFTADGWLARIFQHEYDHLDGVLYVDRLDHANGKAAAKAVKRAGWGTPGLSWMPGVDDLEG
ncbi:MAG: peptide deformylase [Salinibacterium sp.]|nr:peptide deformylase [Salinibacterium sp.]MBF0671212.1 peptide deformylase [Salinibacterium sp.]